MIHSQQSIEFLDILITKDTGGYLQTDLFRKSTAVNSLLHASSSHPSATKKGIPVGQFYRTHRICSTNNAFLQKSMELSTRFEERGYHHNIIAQGFHRAAHKTREELLTPRRRPQPPDQIVCYAVLYSLAWAISISIAREAEDTLVIHRLVISFLLFSLLITLFIFYFSFILFIFYLFYLTSPIFPLLIDHVFVRVTYIYLNMWHFPHWAHPHIAIFWPILHFSFTHHCFIYLLEFFHVILSPA